MKCCPETSPGGRRVTKTLLPQERKWQCLLGLEYVSVHHAGVGHAWEVGPSRGTFPAPSLDCGQPVLSSFPGDLQAMSLKEAVRTPSLGVSLT